MEQFTDIIYRPIYRHVLDNRYRYISFADMAYIGRYFISADTDMPTLRRRPKGRINPGLQPSVWSNTDPKRGLYSLNNSRWAAGGASNL